VGGHALGAGPRHVHMQGAWRRALRCSNCSRAVCRFRHGAWRGT
jgi:hypothetical protein